MEMPEPVFTNIVGFDYYDGPENGIARTLSGQWYRFASIGESKSRLFRAFEFAAIEGAWSDRVHAVLGQDLDASSQRVHVIPEASESLSGLCADIAAAVANEYAVGVGPADMSVLRLVPVSRLQLDEIRQVNNWSSTFRLAHALVNRAHSINGCACLSDEVAKFKVWASIHHPPEARHGEWESEYGQWRKLSRSFIDHLSAFSPATAKAGDIPDLLYALGRDNENEELIDELVEYPDWFMFLLPHVLLSNDADLKWQFASRLGTGGFSCSDAEPALLTLVRDEDEYVSRMALQALGRIGSTHTGDLCKRAWSTGHEYQRIMVLRVLEAIKSPELQRYLSYAKEDGRKYLLDNAAEIEQGFARP